MKDLITLGCVFPQCLTISHTCSPLSVCGSDNEGSGAERSWPSPESLATVIYHAGTNQKARVDELIELTNAGDDYYENSIEEEVVEFSNLDDLTRVRSNNEQSKAEILAQGNVVHEDREVVTHADLFKRIISNMLNQGSSPEDIDKIYQDSLNNRLQLAV